MTRLASACPGGGRTRRLAVLVALAVVAVQTIAVDADAAAPHVTDLTSESFTGATTADGGWFLPSGDSNGACLTAGSDTAQSPIPGCANPAIDSGSGTLRLTTNTLSAVGTVYNTTSLPTSQGLDVRFSTYQWSSHTEPGADGINFILAATDPTNPAPPTSTGPLGGSLGYSATSPDGGTSPGMPGVTNGYLGFGLDVFGNYRNSVFGGTGCPESSPAPQNVTVRGPGNGTAGYCVAGTQQVDQGALDSQYAEDRPTPVPVEVALNPSSSATTSLGGVAIPAFSWLIAYTPVDGNRQSLTGTLPSAATLKDYGYPDSYYDPSTGLPYQLTFGWAASTGGNDEIHEINTLASSTLNGQLPDFNLALSDSQDGALLAGSAGTVAVTPSLEASQGPENRTATVTTTFPTGLVPSNPTSTDYTCSTTDQVVSCTYTPTSSISAGQSLPTLDIPVQVATTEASGLTISSKVSSTDANPAQANRTVSIVTFSAAAKPDEVTYGTAATLSAAGLPADATGTIAFTSGASTLCTATLPDASCTTAPTLAPGSYPITATYGGDKTYPVRTAGTTLVVTQASPELSAAVSDDQVPYGTPDVLSFSGLPAGATGSVTFTADDITLCEVTDVTTGTTCATPKDLDVGSYPVTASYSGDTGFAPATAKTAFTVAKIEVDLHAAVSQDPVEYGTAETLSVGGLPEGASGTVRFTSDDTALCTIADVAVTTSCQAPARLDLGDHPVTARYSGDAHHLKDSASTSFSVVAAQPTLVAAVSDPSVPFGTSDTLSFSGLPDDATGTVTFTTGSQTLCTVDVADASSCASPTDLAAGEHVVTADYSGDEHYRASQARTDLTVTASGSPSFAAAAADPTPTYGTADTLSFSGLVDGATGSVVFTTDGRTLCTVPDVTRSTSCTTPDELKVGRYQVTASYSGDGDHAPASAAASFTVGKATTTLAAAATADSVPYGSAQTLSFGGLPADATGSVTFTDAAGTVLCRVDDIDDTTSCSTSSNLPSGPYAVTARYSGDANHGGSTAETSFTVEAKKNTPPTATDLTVETSFDTSLPVALSGNDAEGDRLTFTVRTAPAHGTLSGTAPNLVYTPQNGYSGPDSFTYTANDDTSRSIPATVSITVDPAAPDPVPLTPAKDFVVDRNGTHHSSSITSGDVKVTKNGELLVAFVSVGGPTTKAQTITKMTGGGLTWTLLQRSSTSVGTSEIWQAYTTRKTSTFRVKASFARSGYSSKITVAGFTHASPAPGAAAQASGKKSAPSVTLTPQATGSVVWAAGRVIGDRYDPRPATGTRIVHDVGISDPRVGYWVQKASTPTTARTPVTISDKIATAYPWGLSAVEIRGATP